MLTLAEIIHKYKALTDKHKRARPMLEMYEEIFKDYRDSSKVFEIGVSQGGSLLAWGKYFSQAQVYGLDNKLARCTFKTGDRIELVELDQSSKEELEVFGKRGPFDIGIDDGSHCWSHQILSFEVLFPQIRSGGLYIIEDIETSYKTHSSPKHSLKYDTGPISAMEYFRNLVDDLNFFGTGLDSQEGKEADWTNVQKTVEWVMFRPNAIVIKKR